MHSPPNHLFTVFAFLAFFLCLIKIPMQLHAWNVGTLLFLIWNGLACLSLGINSIIWNNNTVNWAPVWCDISSRFNIGMSYALPAVILCINRRLYLLASPNSSHFSEADKRREIIIDIAIGVGLPILGIILYFFIQGSRFAILEDYGCSVAIYPSWLAIVFVNVPPLILELIAAVYDCLAVHAFYKRRLQMDQFLSTHQNLHRNRYLRLMCFSITDLFFGIPISVLYLAINIAAHPAAYPGLKQEHFDFSEVLQVPASVWGGTTLGELSWQLNRWIVIWSVFIFFVIFGFSQESRKNYRAALRPVVQAMSEIKIGGAKIHSSSIAEDITLKNETRDLVDSLKFKPESSTDDSSAISFK